MKEDERGMKRREKENQSSFYYFFKNKIHSFPPSFFLISSFNLFKSNLPKSLKGYSLRLEFDLNKLYQFLSFIYEFWMEFHQPTSCLVVMDHLPHPSHTKHKMAPLNWGFKIDLGLVMYKFD